MEQGTNLMRPQDYSFGRLHIQTDRVEGHKHNTSHSSRKKAEIVLFHKLATPAFAASVSPKACSCARNNLETIKLAGDLGAVTV
jgi:hypothetical protein